MIDEQKLELVVPEELEEPIRLDQYLTAELSVQFEDSVCAHFADL